MPLKFFGLFKPFEPFSFKMFLDFQAFKKTFARAYNLKTFKLFSIFFQFSISIFFCNFSFEFSIISSLNGIFRVRNSATFTWLEAAPVGL